MISNYVDRGSRKILLNLRGVSGVDAGALGELVIAADMTERYGGRLKLVNLPAQFTNAFDTANREGDLEAFGDERAAVVSFSMSRSGRPSAF
jgi:anti-anti-sigma regulatory factor